MLIFNIENKSIYYLLKKKKKVISPNKFERPPPPSRMAVNTFPPTNTSHSLLPVAPLSLLSCTRCFLGPAKPFL